MMPTVMMRTLIYFRMEYLRAMEKMDRRTTSKERAREHHRDHFARLRQDLRRIGNMLQIDLDFFIRNTFKALFEKIIAKV